MQHRSHFFSLFLSLFLTLPFVSFAAVSAALVYGVNLWRDKRHSCRAIRCMRAPQTMPGYRRSPHLFFLSLSLVLLFYGSQYYYKLRHIPLCYAVGFILTPADRSCRPLERLAPSVSCPSVLTPLFSFLPLSPSLSPLTHTLTYSFSLFLLAFASLGLFSLLLSLSLSSVPSAPPVCTLLAPSQA